MPGLFDEILNGPRRYQDPGALTFANDPSKFQGYQDTPQYQQLLSSMSANRAAQGKSTQGQLSKFGVQGGGINPYGAVDANNEDLLNSKIGHSSFEDKIKAMGRANENTGNVYERDLNNYAQENADRRQHIKDLIDLVSKGALNYATGGFEGIGKLFGGSKGGGEGLSRDLGDSRSARDSLGSYDASGLNPGLSAIPKRNYGLSLG